MSGVIFQKCCTSRNRDSADNSLAVSNENEIETESEGNNDENVGEDTPDEDEHLLEDLTQNNVDDEHIESSRDTTCILLEAV